MANFKLGWVDMTGVELLSKELRTIRSRLGPAMRTTTRVTAKAIQQDARQRIKAQTTGRTTGKYPQSITYDVYVANASYVKANIGPEVNPRNPKQAIQLEFGNSHQAPKPHLQPALAAHIDSYCEAIGIAVQKAVLP